MSIPNSSAFVAPVPLHRFRIASRRRDVVPQVAQQQLGRQTRTGKNDGLHTGLNEASGDILGRQYGTAPDTQLRIDQRWIVEQNMLLATRSAIVVHQRDRGFDQPLGQLARVGDGGRGTDEAGVRAMETAHPLQPAQHVRHVPAKDTPVGVQLVEDHIAQVREQARPAGVVGENAGVKHVRIGHQQPDLTSNGGALGRGRIAIVGPHSYHRSNLLRQDLEVRYLIVSQGLGGE
jgi:hypothetical protein